jgi:hypothetical protein
MNNLIKNIQIELMAVKKEAQILDIKIKELENALQLVDAKKI